MTMMVEDSPETAGYRNIAVTMPHRDPPATVTTMTSPEPTMPPRDRELPQLSPTVKVLSN